MSAKKSRRGAWTVVTFEGLDAWRAERGIAKRTLAERLGVTNSTYHNWSRGTSVATQATQERIRRFMDSDGTEGRAPLPAEAHSAALDATARILAAYLPTAKVPQDQLAGLVRGVAQAVSA